LRVVDLQVRNWVPLLWLGVALGWEGAPPPFLYTQTARYDAARADRFPAGATLKIWSGAESRALVPSFAWSADACVSFDAKRVLFAGKPKASDAWQIWEMALPAGVPRRLTKFSDDAIAPFYLTDERIVYARRTASGFQLETALVGGSDVNRLTYSPGDHIATAVLRDGRILFDGPHASGRDVFTVYADGTGVETVRCDHGRDRHAGAELASGDIVFATEGSLARFTSARAAQVEFRSPGGEFAGPGAEIAPGEWLATWRPSADRPFGIVRWSAGEVRRVTAGVQPALIQPRVAPKRHPSAVGNREGANLLCLTVYTSKLAIPAGSVASVRLWGAEEKTPLGDAPVESDGSFFVQVPADRAIRFELLDRAGKTVAAEKTWFWARRGEQRVCVGCHAGPERAPENAVPEALLRSTEPVRMRGVE
jgi:hypothetical protein